MDKWDYYYNKASQEYESRLTAPYDYDEPANEDDYDENLSKITKLRKEC